MKKVFFISFSLVLVTSAAVYSTVAQTICPNQIAFGSRIRMPVDRNAQSQLEVTYFTTADPSAIIPERRTASMKASYLREPSTQFVARLNTLISAGLATIRKQETASPYLGQTAELNLERDNFSATAIWKQVTYASRAEQLATLDRATEISVNRGSTSGPNYRVAVLSRLVQKTRTGVHQFVDYDAYILLKPGETAVFKLMGDSEAKRNGGSRSYIAITMNGVNAVDNNNANAPSTNHYQRR